MLIGGSVRRVEEAVVEIDTPVYVVTVTALCINKPKYDLIIRNVDGVWKP